MPDAAAYSMLSDFGVDPIHFDHRWRQVGRCVWCECDRVRLYQGTIPEGHPVAPNPPRSAKNDPATAMLEKWGKG